jgi:hypothetical protein
LSSSMINTCSNSISHYSSPGCGHKIEAFLRVETSGHRRIQPVDAENILPVSRLGLIRSMESGQIYPL